MLINQINPHGGDIYHNDILYDFSANTCPLGTPQEVKNAMIMAVDKISAYPDPYCSKLRLAISVHEGVSIKSIICGNGAADLIYAYAYALQPKKALIVTPTFCEYENALRAVGCAIDYHFLHEENGFQLCGNIDNQYDVVYICNPNNPTGRAYESGLIKSFFKNFTGQIFIDECFCDLTDTPKRYTFSGEIEKNNKIFILKAFTKSYGMAGIRLGYALSSDEILLSKMSEVTQTWNVSTVAQECGIAALKCGDFIAKNKYIIKHEREYLNHELTRLGVTVFKSDTNFILFKSNIDLYTTLLKYRIAIRKCGNFHGLNGNFYRCAIRTHEQNVVLINAMEEVIYG